jgi:hypothetical protein
MEDSTRCGVLLSFTFPLSRKGRGDVSSFLVELGDKAYEHSPEKLGRESIYNARCIVLPFVCLKAEEAILLSLDEDKQLCGISQASLGSERSLSEKTRLLHRDRLSPPS